MGFIGALLIVLLHVKPTPATQFENWIVDFVYSKSGFPGVAVPMFFGLSGYLLASRINERGWWQNAIKKRTKTLLIPFYVWTIILLSAKLALFFLSQYFAYPLLTPNPFMNGLEWLIIEVLGLDVFHLTNIVWYLRSLFLMVIISPIFVFIIKRGIVPTILLGLFLLVIHRYGPYSPSGNYWIDSFLANGLYIGGLLPFLLGIILRVYPIYIVNKTKSFLLGGFWCIFVIISYLFKSVILSFFIDILDVFLIYQFSRIVKFPSWIDGLSIRIYLSHMVFKWILATFIGIIGLHEIWTNVLFWPFLYLIIVSLSILYILKTKNKCPRIETILFGGR